MQRTSKIISSDSLICGFRFRIFRSFFFKTTTIANVVGKVLLIGWSDPHLDPVSQGYALRWIF